LNDECVRETREEIYERPDCRIAGFGRIVDVDNSKGARADNIVFKRNREDIGVDTGREIGEDLKIFEKVFVDIDSDLRRSLNGCLIHALPLPVVDWANKRVANFIVRTGHISNEGKGVFLDK
jgi:hypothetical protein